jgi:CheY-like chemotaxis protein
MTPSDRCVVWAEDDSADRVLFRRAMSQANVSLDPHFVGDGMELLHYLRNEGEYTDREKAPRPNLILLDLNMPRVDGRRVLQQLSEDHDLRRIPVVVVSNSSEPSEIVNSYDLGANSFITKPRTFDDLVKAVKLIEDYWSGVCQVPAA